MKLDKPKNSWAKALYILYHELSGLSMATILTQYDHCFYKFQTRLLEIEKEHPKLRIGREQVEYMSKLDGKPNHYTKYTLLSPLPYVKNLYNLINENGLAGSVSDKSQYVPPSMREEQSVNDLFQQLKNTSFYGSQHTTAKD